MREPGTPALTDEDLDNLLRCNGGRVRRGASGEECVVMKLSHFKRVINSLSAHAADQHQLLGALVRQAGGVIELDAQYVRETEKDLVIEQIGDGSVTTLRVRDRAH